MLVPVINRYVKNQGFFPEFQLKMENPDITYDEQIRA